MLLFTAFASGLIFGFGLLVSGMVNPAKVLGFLDVAGRWDPSLALVMVGAIAVGTIAFFFAGRWAETILHAPMQLPKVSAIDGRLVFGSTLFGAGWGLAGICPGPALTLVGAGIGKGFVFVGAMLAGMVLFEVVERVRAKAGVVAAPAPAPRRD